MKKTVYSLVLSDDVVAKIDRLSYQRGLSRSQMVDRVLAEYVSHETTEQRMETVIHSLARLSEACAALRFYNLPTASMAYYCGALEYPYRPTVRYLLELYAEESEFLGALKVTFRTKSDALLAELERFFACWHALECACVSENVQAEIGKGRYLRVLFKPTEPLSADDLGRLITRYVDRLNQLMNEYFHALANGYDPAATLKQRYLETLNEQIL